MQHFSSGKAIALCKRNPASFLWNSNIDIRITSSSDTKNITRDPSIHWLDLRTYSFINKVILHTIYPVIYSNDTLFNPDRYIKYTRKRINFIKKKRKKAIASDGSASSIVDYIKKPCRSNWQVSLIHPGIYINISFRRMPHCPYDNGKRNNRSAQ